MREKRLAFKALVAMLLVAFWLPTGCSADSRNASKERTNTTQTAPVAPGHSSDTTEKGDTSKQKTTASGLTSAENSRVIRLTHMGAAIKPVFSPDGRKIAFADYPGGLKVRNGTMMQQGVPELYVMNADGTHVTRIADLGQHIEVDVCLPGDWAFSPDGTRIAFSIDESKEPSCFAEPNIYVADIDGSNLHNLSNSPDYGSKYPSWSPDGKNIAFERHILRQGFIESRISSINPDGTNLSNLSHVGSWPTFSPTDEKIAFRGRTGVYVMDADGTGVKRLSNYVVANLALAWSPDGDQIAFVGLDNSYNFYLDVMNADGSHLTPVISPETLDYFVFSADGKWIAYSKRKKGDDDIYAVHTDGTTQINLTNNDSANDFHPTFSPDGKKMAFESTSYDDSGKLVSEIYLMNLD